MLVFDTSSIVYAWDNYPIDQFPNLWHWLEGEFDSRNICLSEVVLDEVEEVSPECHAWLCDQDVNYLAISDPIVTEALRYKALLEIGAHFGGGVGENDLFIVATARINGVELVTNEALQKTLPKTKANYKIPALCAMEEVKVTSCNFLEYLRRSKVVFG